MNATHPTLTIKTAKILLIDDASLSRSVLRTIFRDEGCHQIREAKDAHVGFTLIEHFRPDLVCLDIQMPGKSGLELLADLKIIAPATRVLMITANHDAASISASMTAGADGYVVKPFTAGAVIAAAEAAFGRT